jgi:hypothetical protein
VLIGCMQPMGLDPLAEKCYAAEATDSIMFNVFGRERTFRYRDSRCPPFRWRALDSASRTRAARETH